MVLSSARCCALAVLVFALLLVQCQPAIAPTRPADATARTTTTARAPQPFDASTEAAITETAARLFRAESSRVSAQVLEPLMLRLDITGSDKRDLRVSLARVWVGYQSNPAVCEANLRDFVSKSVRILTTPEAPASREQVIAVLRPRAFVDAIGGPSTPMAMLEPFVDDLYAIYVVDTPDGTRSLKPADLDALKLTRDQVAPLAKANLLQRLGDPGAVIGDAKPGAIVVTRMGDAFYQSSRLLLTDGWAALSAKLAQPIVVAVPANDAMFVAIGPSPAEIENLGHVVAKTFGSAERPVSRRLFRWNAGRWEVVP